MGNLGEFNAAEVEPNSFDVLPAGDYDAIIIASERKPTSKGGHMLKLELQVLNGEYQNRKIWDNLNIWNSSDKAVQIAKGTLSAICRAVGVMTPKDSTELHNKPLRIKVAVRKSEEYGEQNQIKAYKPRLTGATYSEPSPPADPVTPVADTETPW